MTRIERLAARYLEASDEHKMLKRRRAACFCEHAEPDAGEEDDSWMSSEDDGYFPPRSQPTQKEPCWKGGWKMIDNGSFEPDEVWLFDVAPADWCESCRRRNVIHERMKRVGRRKSARLSALLSATRAMKRHSDG